MYPNAFISCARVNIIRYKFFKSSIQILRDADRHAAGYKFGCVSVHVKFMSQTMPAREEKFRVNKESKNVMTPSF